MDGVVTPEIEREMITIRDYWAEIGRDTRRADRPRAEAGIKGAYEVANMAPPQEIHWVQSPRQGVILCAQWIKADDMMPWGDPKLPEVSVDETLRAIGISCYGQHDSGWHAFYQFLQKYLPDKVERLEPQREIAKSAHWWWPFENGTIVCERPIEVHTDGEGRLHNLDGPAIVYEDGFSVCAYHGVRVPLHALQDRHSITEATIRGTSESTQRRALIALAPLSTALLFGSD